MSSLIAYIGIGANLGDRAAHIAAATRGLAAFLSDLTVAPAVESLAVDRFGSPDPAASPYLNTAARGLFSGTPRELFKRLVDLEITLGRDPAEKSLYLPRTIDLDILYLEADGHAVIIHDPDLVTPHPRIAERSFCTGPLDALGLHWPPPTLGRGLDNPSVAPLQ